MVGCNYCTSAETTPSYKASRSKFGLIKTWARMHIRIGELMRIEITERMRVERMRPDPEIQVLATPPNLK